MLLIIFLNLHVINHFSERPLNLSSDFRTWWIDDIFCVLHRVDNCIECKRI